MIHKYENIISLQNLLVAWKEFLRGKKSKSDVQFFSLNLFENIHALHSELKSRQYKHGLYKKFVINDPKPRIIHKTSVRDRLTHHAVYRVLYPFFAKKFIADSYSCQKMKGTHKAIKRFRDFGRRTGKNNRRTCWVLKCDIKKFFANIDHSVLLKILMEKIRDKDVMGLLKNIIRSFKSTREGIGLPLGNLTSQLLVNVYMNEFDQWMKHRMKVKFYIRYADDFLVFSDDKSYLDGLAPKIAYFLEERLKLSLHPDKVFIKTLASGVDFLGWVHFPYHRVLRNATKRRMLRKLENNQKEDVAQSYLGLLKHGNAQQLSRKIEHYLKTI